jgi:beta-lactamase class D
MRIAFEIARLSAALVAAFAAACSAGGAARTPESARAREPSRSPVPATATTLADSTRLTTFAIAERPELGAELTAERVSGTVALFDSTDNVLVCSDKERCRRRYLPASTFKIANSIIGLETGALSDPETLLKWDGTSYSVPEWNQDLTLRRAVQVSCLPCFQGIARDVGEPRMREWLARLEYGNQDVSGGVDRFWVWGGLRISPIEQLDFLRRLDSGKLPIDGRVRDTVIDLITLDVRDDSSALSAAPISRPRSTASKRASISRPCEGG